MIDADAVGPDASFIEDTLELSLLAPGPVPVPVDRPLKDYEIDRL